MEAIFYEETSVDIKREIAELVAQWNTKHRNVPTSSQATLMASLRLTNRFKPRHDHLGTNIAVSNELWRILRELYIIHETMRFLMSVDLDCAPYMRSFDELAEAFKENEVPERPIMKW